ncbi:aminotransferase class I/II-fold pyridoxal phosphate-dependent enzyme [Pseudoduganella sp. FT25W]|uniref:Aminotransferase class I/II-fold pyridoxal phosphate-dependent enzyme n=1 Tax=Duganella alba TaxID=2666081 RepID=A0A6L5QEB1_9BURK|nr:PLP-dependent aminotransferase family protein [Duganella alba]MRX07970.1 aminotransferase class I/II-fold pyridoxal phosphate-dependent enzyme [Duganella alba]MRX16493.1 aminotransferase class I/II-fold pyridoxal phosphate-dependent enzyme [Duganella alba]
MDLVLLISGYSAQNSHRGWPRQRLLHECLRAAIRNGTLAAGARLAASRALAEELGVARNTVLYAYEQLASEGFVVTDRRGTVVAAVTPERAPARRALAAPQAGLSQRARSLRAVPGPADRMGAFVPGVPALELFPMALWRRMLERALRAMTVVQLNYGDPAGEPQLREAIADHLRAARGVVCDAAQVFITDGTQSSLDLCMRALADDSDTVWIENPGYGGALAAARGAGLAVAGIDVDDEGMAPTAEDWLLRPPRLIYTTPSHQYPIGSVLSLRRRLALIEAARAAGALIIEDDYDSEFRHDGAPLHAMQGLAADAPVVYLGTFSKTMFPSLRIGFVVVPASLAEAFAQMRAQSSSRGRVAEQLALAEFLRSGQFVLHLRRMRRLYRQRRDALVAALALHLGSVATVHGGSSGMHLSLRFQDARIDDVAIVAQALQRGIAVNALSTHDTQGDSGWKGLMLGYAQVPAEQMEGLVKQLAALVHLAAYAANCSAAGAAQLKTPYPPARRTSGRSRR